MSDDANQNPGYPGYPGQSPTPPEQPPTAEIRPAAAPAEAVPPAAVPPAYGAPTAPTVPLPPAPAASAPPASAPPAAPPPGVAAAPQPSAPSPAPAKRSIALPVIAALAVGAIVGGATGAGVAVAVSSNSSSTTATAAKPENVTINATKSVTPTTAIAAKASPSVVTINVTDSSEAGTGSGVILDTEGHVLTNTHVVTLDGATASGTIEVTTSDGSLYSASVVGTDPTMDLAVIQLKNATNLTPISFADSDKVNVGDQVVAIGAPLGLSNTVTEGIVSALNRSIEIASSAAPSSSDDSSGSGSSGGSSGGPFDFWNYGNGNGDSSGSQSSTTATIKIPVIQTDAAINPGNSGGALLDSAAKLIGINVAIASTGSTSSTDSQSGSIGVGFAIPSDVAKRIADELIANGKATHGLLGASVTDATAKDSSTVGAVIAEAPLAGGAAAAAGLQKGDVVTRFNGKPITDAVDLTAQVRALAGGASAKLTYVRDGKATTVTVKLGTLQT